LARGDDIWVSFPGGIPFSYLEESTSLVVVPVGLDGVISIPTMSPFSVAGMTLHNLQQTIEGLVSRNFAGMIVTVGLARSANFQIPVTGQIINPGFITVNGLTRLSEALQRTGGVSSSGTISRILIVSAQSDSTEYNLNDFITNGNMESNPLMQRNSRIHVFNVAATIVVEGALSVSSGRDGLSALSKPPLPNRISVEFIEGESACEAIARVGGVSTIADLARCYVYRSGANEDYQYIPFSLENTDNSVLLQPGDRLVIPASSDYINVTGEVIFAGPITYSPGMTTAYYIGIAGGFTSSARRNSIKVLTIENGNEHVDINDVIPPGATIEVPRVPVKFWEDYLTILTGMATVIIAYQSIF
jgi:protein involved in polysaccharide export with SLBB domain